MPKLFKWFWMLNKRLYKKPSFVLLLILIPLCVALFSFIAQQSGGFLHIVLAQDDLNDAASAAAINAFLTEDSLIRFTTAPSKQDAIDEVKNGLADEAWVFTADTENRLHDFISKTDTCIVSVFTKEQNVAVRLAREKLSGILYQYCAKAYFIEYVRTHFTQLQPVSDEQLVSYFQSAGVDEQLFVFENPDTALLDVPSTNFLTSPLRGLLAVFTVLCGLAAVLYYKQDEQIGTFSHVKLNQKGLVMFGCVLTAVLNVCAVLFLSLVASSLSTTLWRELLITVLFAFACTSFCVLLGSIFDNIATLSAILPLFAVVFIGICPIFFDFRVLHAVQLLFPPTYYINALYQNAYMSYIVIYSAVCLLLSSIIRFAKQQLRYRI